MKTINISERNKLIENDDGSYTLECHCKPIHYLVSGEWQDIKTEIKLYSGQYLNLQNKVTVGLRNDLNTYKYMGMRYDKDTQLEFSLESVKYDNVEILQNKVFREIQDPVFNNGYYEVKEIGDITLIHNIGDNGVKTWFKIDKNLGKFEILLKVHIKGFNVLNDKIDNEYVPDKYGRFNFGRDDKALYWINLPQGKDSNDNIIRNISHKLFEQDGELYYLKELESTELLNMAYPIYVDASTYYSQTADGCVKRISTTDSWSTLRDSAAGTYCNTIEQYADDAVQAYYDDTGETYSGISRSFFYFDTSDLTEYAVISSATLSLYATGEYNSGVSVQEGTQNDILTINDYDAFTGSIFGYDFFWSAYVYNNIPFNSTGISSIKKTGVTKICVREYQHDYQNVNPGAETNANGMYYSDYTGTSRDPKLSITYIKQITKNVFSDILVQKKDKKLILY